MPVEPAKDYLKLCALNRGRKRAQILLEESRASSLGAPLAYVTMEKSTASFGPWKSEERTLGLGYGCL